MTVYIKYNNNNYCIMALRETAMWIACQRAKVASLQSRGIPILRFSEETKYLKQNWAKAYYPAHQQEQEEANLII